MSHRTLLLTAALLLAGPYPGTTVLAGEAKTPPSPPAGSGSTIYRSVDAEGHPVFSDQATDDSRRVELGTTIRLPPAPAAATGVADAAQGEAPQFNYRMLAIDAPKQDEVIRDNAGNLVVKGSFSPPLHKDHKVQLLIDGRLYASGDAAEFELEHVDRGTHQLQLQIVDTLSKRVLIQSEPVSMTLMRISVLSPARRN